MTVAHLATTLGAILFGQIITFWLLSMFYATRRRHHIAARQPRGVQQAGQEENRPPLSAP